MAKVKINNVDKLLKTIKDFLDNKMIAAKIMVEIGDFVENRVKSFTRSGKSIAGKNPVKLKKLSESYKDMRRGAVKFRTMPDGKVRAFPEPDERLKEVDPQFFDPEFSNLTFTGQMLNAVKTIVNAKNKSVKLFVEETKRIGKYEKLTNAEVAGYVKKNGRPFLGLDDNGIKRVNRIVLDEIRRQIRKSGLNKK